MCSLFSLCRLFSPCLPLLCSTVAQDQLYPVLAVWSPGPGLARGNIFIADCQLRNINTIRSQHSLLSHISTLHLFICFESVFSSIQISYFSKRPPEHYRCGVQSVSTIMKTSEQLAAQFSRSLPRVQSVGSWCSQVYGLEGATKWKITRKYRQGNNQVKYFLYIKCQTSRIYKH